MPNFSCELSKLARMGFYSFIEKPCTVGQLGAGVMSAFDYHEKLLSGAAHITERITCLSKREREVGSLVVRGLTNQEIAAELGISIKTVKAHRARVMEKTNSDSLVDLVRCFDSFSQLSIRGE
ncbi:response regulator transcription factor [Ferriphaselus amnicola]|uniref:response regulator transcription factor n=1 Tax=Ferriphaselus amnicola TaxID=1188319 RepID=UPI001E37C1C0|nr:LuxR C-terminal-related transcriptional regulator [Ferriphaselus amnicola]